MKGLEEFCPTSIFADKLGGKWKLAIIYNLRNRSLDLDNWLHWLKVFLENADRTFKTNGRINSSLGLFIASAP